MFYFMFLSALMSLFVVVKKVTITTTTYCISYSIWAIGLGMGNIEGEEDDGKNRKGNWTIFHAKVDVDKNVAEAFEIIYNWRK